MSPRVTYWTGTWDPSKEAISKEIMSLRTGDRARAPVVSFAPTQPVTYRWRGRVLTLSGRLWPVLRGVAALVEPSGDVSHVFGGQSSWHLIRALGRRPIILTAAIARRGAERLPPVQLAAVVVESERAIDEWIEAGVSPERIELIRPGIDLEWFHPMPAPSGRFTLLFASTPSDPEEIESRGIPTLVELARARPDIAVLLPWRTWGDVESCRRRIQELRPPSNMTVVYGDCPDIREQYAKAHATIACFSEGVGKLCPNFVLEGLACGRPAISTATGGLTASLIEGGGLIADRDIESLSAAVSQLQRQWAEFSMSARRLAEKHFDVREFRARYERLYHKISRPRGDQASLRRPN